MGVSYYRFTGQQGGNYVCSVCDHSYPLLINCLGRYELDRAFVTECPGGREDYYFMYIVAGELEIQTASGSETVGSGHAIVFAPNKTYTRENKSKWVLRNEEFTPEQIAELDKCYDDMIIFANKYRKK